MRFWDLINHHIWEAGNTIVIEKRMNYPRIESGFAISFPHRDRAANSHPEEMEKMCKFLDNVLLNNK